MEFKAQKRKIIGLNSKIKGEFSLTFKDWEEVQNWSPLKETLFLFEVNMQKYFLESRSFAGLGLFSYFRYTFRNRKVHYVGKRKFSKGK